MAIIGAAGCGGTPPTPEELKQDRAMYLRELEPMVDAKRRAEERRRFQKEENRCRARVEPLLRALRRMDSRLSVGLTFDEYRTGVGDIEVAYGEFDPGRPVKGKCRDVATSAHYALLDYRDALDSWSFCVVELQYCEINDDNRRAFLLNYWESAPKYLDDGFRQMDAIGSQTVDLEPLSRTVPASATGSVYSAINTYLCPRAKTDDERVACSDLAAVLQGGIQADEANDLNGALKELADPNSPGG